MAKIEICTVGGYDEVGKNMTAIKVDDDVILIDMGLNLEEYISYTEDDDVTMFGAQELIAVDAIPNVTLIEDWRDKVRAIIPTHAHLDHIGAIPYLADKYSADILCTPFSAAVLRRILKDEKVRLENRIRVLNVNSTCQVTDDIGIEFISMTHSTPQTVMVAVHTKYGTLIYANDFKIDLTPVLGKKPNLARLKELGDKGVLCLIMESTYAPDHMKTPSEMVAKHMLRHVMLDTDSKGKAVIVTTFSSHMARLKSIIEFAKKMNRKVLFMGRSLAKYTEAAEEVGLVQFSKEVEIVKYGDKIKRRCKRITERNRHQYVYVVTGHQGEPRATLNKMVDKRVDFDFRPGDHVIFSCKTIPTATNIANRKSLEEKLKARGVRIFNDVHVSGHAAREDLREMLEIIRPKHLIPAHGDAGKTESLAELALGMGYKKDKVHIMHNGNRLILV